MKHVNSYPKEREWIEISILHRWRRRTTNKTKAKRKILAYRHITLHLEPNEEVNLDVIKQEIIKKVARR